MKTPKVNPFLLILILFVGLSLFAKMTRYESEDLPANSCCDSIIVDTTASDSHCRVAYVDVHSTGHMQYGPDTTLSPGHYIAIFRLKRGNTNPTIQCACDLDIVSSPGATWQGMRSVYASSFDSTDTWQNFEVGIYLEDTTQNVEFRIWWVDTVDI